MFRIRQTISLRWQLVLGVLSVGLLVAGYTVLAQVRHARNPNDRTIPTWSLLLDGVKRATLPDRSAQALRAEDAEPAPAPIWLVQDARATFGRLGGGLALGCLASIVLGLLMGCFAPIEAFFLPPLKFLAKIPPTAMMAIFFALVGLGYEMYVAMIGFGVLPTLAQSVHLSVRKSVPMELLDKAATLGASRLEVIWNVIWKQVLPEVLDAVRLQVGPAMVYLIAAEMLVGSIGFGYRIRMEQRLLNMSVVYYYLVLLGGSGFLIDWLLRVATRKLCPWWGRA